MQTQINPPISLQVSEGLFVSVLQHPQHHFLMPTKDVALGYGISGATIRKHKETNGDEFKEGKHFLRGVSITHTLPNVQPHAVFWTKAGIVRLGFFIKSERAKQFRDWAEGVILEVTAPKAQLPAVAKRKHNRLTTERLVDLMTDIAEIENKDLRMRIIDKLVPYQNEKGGQS